MIGKKIAPVAVLLIKAVTTVATKQTAVITTNGLSPQISRIPVAIICANPVFSMAVPSTTDPANTIRIFQLMLFHACSREQQREATISKAAKKADCKRVMIFSDESKIIPNMIKAETSVFLPILGISSDSKKCR